MRSVGFIGNVGNAGFNGVICALGPKMGDKSFCSFMVSCDIGFRFFVACWYVLWRESKNKKLATDSS